MAGSCQGRTGRCHLRARAVRRPLAGTRRGHHPGTTGVAGATGPAQGKLASQPNTTDEGSIATIGRSVSLLVRARRWAVPYHLKLVWFAPPNTQLFGIPRHRVDAVRFSAVDPRLSPPLDAS